MATQTAPASRAASTNANTGKVQGRRTVRFNNYDDILADIEQLQARGYRQLGNWSLGQMAKHIGEGMRMSLDDFQIRQPWIVKFVARNFLLKSALRGPLKPGFKLPKKAAPKLIFGATDDDEGVAHLRQVIARMKKETPHREHAFFGPLSPEQWRQLSLRHSELHLSFLLPA